MLINELIDLITNNSNPAELSHAADKFFEYFLYIQKRCNVDEHSGDERTDGLIRLLPDHIKKLNMISKKIELIPGKIRNHRLPLISLWGAVEIKIEMLAADYHEPCSEIVEVGTIAANITTRHLITHESKLTKELKKQLRVEIAVICQEQAPQFASLPNDEKENLINKIMDRIKGNHNTMRVIHRYYDPLERDLHRLFQLTDLLKQHLLNDLDTLLKKISSKLSVNELVENVATNETSLLDEIKKLTLSKSQLAKVTHMIKKIAAVNELNESIKQDHSSDVVKHYQNTLMKVQPLLMKNADTITKRLLHWIGHKLNIKRFQNQALNRYAALDKYVTNHMLLHTKSTATIPTDNTQISARKNKK